MANRADPFYSAITRLKRAKEHILRLDKRTKRFFQTVSTTNIIEPDSDGVTELHKTKLSKSFPESCDVAATEAIQALRDTLDYTGAASAIAAGHTTPTSAKFPFGDTPSDVDTDIRRGGKQLPPEIQTLFRGFKPYNRGNEFLWPLNKLRNPATHRILVPIVTMAAGVRFQTPGIFSGGTSGGTLDWCSEWNSAKNEITFARVSKGAKFQHDAKLSVFISFNEPPPIRGKSAILVLNEIAAEVERVIKETKAECRRIGLIT